MKKFSQCLMLIVGFITLSGCSSVGVLAPNTSIDEENESLFIIGIQPENHRISFFPGSINDGVFEQNIWKNATLYSSSDEGFIVSTVRKDEIIGLTNVTVRDEDSPVWTHYEACNGQQTHVLDAPVGKILYVGDLQYSQTPEQSLSMKISDNFEEAKAYMEKHHPHYADRLERFDMFLAPVNEACIRTILVSTKDLRIDE